MSSLYPAQFNVFLVNMLRRISDVLQFFAARCEPLLVGILLL